MILKFKRPQTGDTRTNVSFCLIPRRFYSDTHTVWLWFHRLETKQEYSRRFKDGHQEWMTVEELYKN